MTLRSVGLADFIDHHREAILAAWEELARRLAPRAGMDSRALRDHAPHLLTAVISDMKAPQSAQEQSDKSKGLKAAGRIGALSQCHATLRLEHGFTLAQLVTEYRALRATVFQLWTNQADDPAGALRFNEAIDEALVEAAERFAAETQRRDDQRAQREFLAEAGAALASSLEYRTTLATVSNLAVPELADWCTVELLEPGATAPTQVALAHVDPSKVQFARELAERYPPDPSSRNGVPEVIRSGKSILYPELPQALIEAGARDSEHLRILRELRLESAMVVPLTGRERVFGAMTFIYAASGRRYTERDLAFFEDFARRAAMAIENAQAHAAVRSTLEFQERFVAVLGHDLRNPLSSIDMAVGVLRQRAVAANDAPTVRVLDRMRSSSARMERMIEQILDLTRIRLGGGLDVQPAPMDLCDALTAVVEELRLAHPARSIELRCSSLRGTWDRDRLEQVFSNLIANAVHYGDPAKPVTVEAHPTENGGAQVKVQNDGEPIPEALRGQLFDPFRRGGRDSRAAKTAGLGLGLYISREIVRAHGGELDVRSSAAEGTLFRLLLPRSASLPATKATR